MTHRPLTETQRDALKYLLRYPYRAAADSYETRPYGFSMTTWRSLEARGRVMFSTSAHGLNITITAAGVHAIHPNYPPAGVADTVEA